MERVTKRESVTLRPDYLYTILKSENVKICIFLCFKFLYFYTIIMFTNI